MKLRYLLLGLCATATASPAVSQGSLPARLLAMHNAERARWRLPPLQWDSRLAASAASYASTLAGLGRLQHSPPIARAGQGENLWMGTRDAFTPEQMVGGWLSERSDFRPGVFPRVSRSGHWSRVGHYSQIVWPKTTHVGCAIQSSRTWHFLICRYAPAGNVVGGRVP